jgi:tetratricopeptide (TPR) repeat protein
VPTPTLSLRQTWNHACSNIPHDTGKIADLLEDGLNRAEAENSLDEAGLLKIVDGVNASTEQLLPPEAAKELNLNLRRAVYEYLLAVDAATVTETAPADGRAVAPPPREHEVPLIGAEEVAELEKSSPPPPPPAESHLDLIRSAAAAADEASETGGGEDQGEYAGKSRFGLFHRGKRESDQEDAGGNGNGNGHSLVVAPQAGFHIGDPTDLVQQAPAPAAPPESRAGIQPLSDPAPPPHEAAPERGPGLPGGDLTQARRDIEERLRRKRCDDAAALLQQLAQEIGGREVAELAVDAGDRCRGLGKRRAATNCYLAAARADPVFATPLLRLADICIDDKDIDLAVSYLERVARLSRLSGDLEGALRVYRKIAVVAPYREDVLELLLRAQTTGRIDP